jgi:PPK2 family polyphosphate:nucleotide phosphotransferase
MTIPYSAADMRDTWVVQPGSRPHLDAIDPAATPGLKGGRAAATAALEKDRDALVDLQGRLWAEARRSLLVVLQGMDASGKDGTVKHVFSGVNPQGTRVTSFKEPSPEELAHDFLWRVHRAVPGAGEIGIFNRSQYEDVLAARVRKLVPEKVWRARYPQIVAFEEMLSANGVRVVKCFLHISAGEQRKRLQERLADPTKCWKFRVGDLDDRKLWGDYMAAYGDALEHTSSAAAPWYVIPADHKWYRNWAISRILLDTLTEMDPKYPERPDLDGVTVT